MSLAEYEAKRDFGRTPEPKGRKPARRGAREERRRFAIQEHHATSMHWDLRLEHDGVLWSWALPRGVPRDPKRNNLAVRTEDHPLEYLTFSGTIPEGEYGAGDMYLWDQGEYELHEATEGKVVVTLHGERVQGRFALFRTGGDEGRDWMIHRMDGPADPEWVDPPDDLRPMLATPGPLPDPGKGWAFEVKWDGIRAIGYADGGRLRLWSRNGNEVTDRYPELRLLGRQLGYRQAVLDGEVVAFDAEGRPSFQRLQRRMHVRSASAQRRLSSEVPVVYMVFDVLWLEGRSMLDRPYSERRAALEELGLEGPSWRTPTVAYDDAGPLVAFVEEHGLEGVVAKRVDSRYEPGRRSKAWIKHPLRLRQELVVGGWLEGEGARQGTIGALLLGYHDDDGRLHFAGRVGTGFTESELRMLKARLAELATDENPFDVGRVPKGAHFVEPSLVAEIRFNEWTDSGTVRQPSYLGLRDDRDPATVVRES